MAYKNKGQQQQQQEEKKQLPVATFRCGVLSVSIWEQDGANGVFFRVIPQRSFKREGSEDWEYSDTFGRDDLLTIAELMRTSWNWIVRKEAEMKKAAK